MKQLYKHITNLTFIVVALVGVLMAGTVDARALPADTYAAASRLSSGKWVKISVKQSGVYLLTNAQLRSMGFGDATTVNVYGYGATELPNILTTDYIDDLPVVQSVVTPQGIIFYGVGPDGWAKSSDGNMVPRQNYYTTEGYYFVSDASAERPEIPSTGLAGGENPVTDFDDYIAHERELVSLGETGHTLVGEDFMYQNRQSFTFTLTDRVEGTPMWMGCSFMVNAQGTTTLGFTANNKSIDSDSPSYINPVTDSYGHYRELYTFRTFDFTGSKLTLGLNFNTNSTVVKSANLNYLSVRYRRKLLLDRQQLPFYINTPSSTAIALEGATASTRIWDITAPLSLRSVDAKLESGTMVWTINDRLNQRRYVAFNDTQLPSPTIVGDVANQNIHGKPTPDMVIFVPSQWTRQAYRIAALHPELDVLVLNQEDVFNEFSSGSPDAQAFRKCLKMFYDRSDDSTEGARLQYALFFGRGIYDNRKLTAVVKPLNYVTMPIWQTVSGMSDTESYTSDDIFAFLEDNSGINMSSDRYSIAVGRMPVTSAYDAEKAVNKLYDYLNNMPYTQWRTRALIIADDDDNAVHMQQSDAMVDAMMASNGGNGMTYQKVYTDAYDKLGGRYPDARAAMFKALNEGVAWWTFVGHANTTSWTHEGLLTYTDINTMYLRHYPIIYAATCDFMRWDAAAISAAEIMWRLDNGGAIAVFAANRPVYIAYNGDLSLSFGREAFARDDNGKPYTLGQIFQRAKNNFTSGGTRVPDSNKLRYALMGDPAMPNPMPAYRAVITEIAGTDLSDPEAQPVIQARQEVTMKGHIVAPDGSPADDFNGIIASTLFDAEYSVTTKANGEKGKVHVFDQQGYRLFQGNDSVRAGQFDIKVSMPSAVADNFRPAAISLYAHSDESSTPRQATGVNRDFYVFGTDYSITDDVPPVIKAMYLNHPSFAEGGRVNASPMLIAEIADNRGINMSISGIGHQMNLQLDGKRSYNNVCEYYTPSTYDALEGTIAYPLDNLTEGHHTLRLRVWDTSDNFTEQTITFVVDAKVQPEIFNIYTDTQTATTHANFYLMHDRPDAMVEVKISVYNMLGREVWSSVSKGRSDMYLSSPVTWDLNDKGGVRVGRGIYLYRATVTCDGIESSTATRRLAVAGPN